MGALALEPGGLVLDPLVGLKDCCCSVAETPVIEPGLCSGFCGAEGTYRCWEAAIAGVGTTDCNFGSCDGVNGLHILEHIIAAGCQWRTLVPITCGEFGEASPRALTMSGSGGGAATLILSYASPSIRWAMASGFDCRGPNTFTFVDQEYLFDGCQVWPETVSVIPVVCPD